MLVAGLWVLGAVAAPPGAGTDLVGPGSHGAYLDGVALLAGTVVLPGETVTTERGGAAALAPATGAAGVVELGGGSAATVGGNGLTLTQGAVLVLGRVVVATPQGAVVAATRPASRLVVNGGPAQSAVGVLNGAVGVEAAVIHAGSALQFERQGGQLQFSTLQLSQRTRPDPNAVRPRTIPASQSQ